MINTISNKIQVNASPRMVVIITSCLVAIGQMLLILGSMHEVHFESVISLRKINILVCLIVLVIALLHKKWSKYSGPILYTLIFIPIFFIGWENQIVMAEGNVQWKPFVGFPPVFFLLAILVAGSYVVNFILLALFSTEVMILWFYLMPQLKSNVLLSGEPYNVILFAVFAAALLSYRCQEKKTIRRLMMQQARTEFIENLARTFLSLRDRSNTPMQTLYFLVEIFKRKKTVTDEDIAIMEKSLVRLNELNKKLIRYESHVPWTKELMTEDEIDGWLLELERELNRGPE